MFPERPAEVDRSWWLTSARSPMLMVATRTEARIVGALSQAVWRAIAMARTAASRLRSGVATVGWRRATWRLR
jgi:hypothetical protein